MTNQQQGDKPSYQTAMSAHKLEGYKLIAIKVPECLQRVVYLANYEKGRFIHDAYFRLDQSECNLVDQWLVELEHPLAYQPGTQESRIVAIVKELAELGNP
jgi:hypothetical protein